MKRYVCILNILFLGLIYGCSKHEGNVNYRNNPEPLFTNAYIKLPLGSVKPSGWLKSQMEAQAQGLSGHIDEFWPDLVNSSWRGGDGEAWERGPYFLDGLVPLAYLLDDEKLKEKVTGWIAPIIASSSDSGWYGPEKNKDRWPLAVANKVLMQYYEATGDTNAINVLLGYFRYLHESPPDWPDKDWRGVRAMENAVTGYWLYRQTGEKWILETIESIQKNSSDWTTYYENFPWDSAASANKEIPLNWGPVGLTAHVVNNAMAIKYPGLWYQQSKDERYKNAVFAGIKKYDLHHGQTGGRFSGDEHLSGKSPSQGTELCSVVEYMFSLGELFTIFGENSLADRLELLTYNALPGTTTPDYWAHQYDQQSNQVIVSGAKRDWSTNGDYSNIYGLMPNFACCLANMHQGWPKFVENMWMATNDNGLIAVAYGPSVVKARVGEGHEVTIKEETDYPFRGLITFTISTENSIKFPIELRIPGWADSVQVSYKNKTFVYKENSIIKLKERWKNGDQISMEIPMDLRFERRFNNSVSLLRGPLYFSLRMDKEYRSVKINYDNFGYQGSVDWEILPKSPWNYGLLIDMRNPMRGINLKENEPGRLPFADKGDMIWSEEAGEYIENQTEAPIVIKARGIRIPSWTIKNNSADVPPVSPVAPEGDPEIIELVPYGCARLRITEFPVMNITLMEEVIK
ncbi:MAG TPA: beta-L-arabinofuranosidase domain-containing protein [Bacteroidales bacterium]|nr:beta-L-arabinofuranosidase domain-containing protein [Bacteroidales bacterium]